VLRQSYKQIKMAPTFSNPNKRKRFSRWPRLLDTPYWNIRFKKLKFNMQILPVPIKPMYASNESQVEKACILLI